MNFQKNQWWILLGVLSLLSACGNSDLSQTSELGELRILALQVDAPEVNPTVDGSFTVVPVVSDLNGAGRTLNYQIEMCIDPGVSRGASVSCDGDSTRPSARTGSFTLSGPYYTGPVSPQNPGDFDGVVPATILVDRNPIDVYNGVSYLVIVRVSAEDGTEEIAYRRVVATARTELNQNPSLLSVRKEGESVDLLSFPELAVDEELSLIAVLGNGYQEDYSALTLLGEEVSRSELVTVSWYAPQGTFTFLRTDPEGVNRYQKDADSNIAPFLFAVVRDDRGGVGFLSQVVGQ